MKSLENQMEMLHDPNRALTLSTFVTPKMVIPLSKKKSVELEPAESFSFFYLFIMRTLCGVPAVVFLLILVFLLSSSTTTISGQNILGGCMLSRKLNSCISAPATQPKIQIPIPSPHSSSPVHHDSQDRQVSNNVTVGNPNSFSYKTSFAKDRDEKFQKGVKAVEELLQVHRSWRSDHNQSSTCSGRGIYVYEMPSKFNNDLLKQCSDMTPRVDFCKYFSNDALGEPIQLQKLGKHWYQTHQFSLEPIFHSRVLKHPCRVYDQNEAKLFYVPFYGGLDMMRCQFQNVSDQVKDSLGLEVVQWLKMQKPWNKNSGKDHVLVLSHMSWDFRRYEGSTWGTRFLELDEIQNPIKVLIEQQPWKMNEIGVPYPTHFHPQSDDDIILWQSKIMSSNRRSLVSFAGAARPGDLTSIRSILINQCITSATEEKCRFMDCSSHGCEQPGSVIELFMESEFCLQPPGDSPTRKSMFDSLVSGCIPVIFNPFTAYYQYSWHLPEDHEKYSVFIDEVDVRGMKVNVVERLMKVTLKERDEMRRYIAYELMPGLVYGHQDAHFDKFQDSFSITMNNLVNRVTNLD